ncbi:mucoidy inhibitor MuiA family protein [Luedemannella flava]|uniref:mucoidy inhibitor MuiA family protein n=1 Tax=Luedemannella flava TaxID=349316 RepID=UPI0031DFB45D
MAEPVIISAPVVAVTVYPDRARITRRGRVDLSTGEHRVVFDDLPLQLVTDSVRVAGTGPATVLGVDVARRYRPRTTDEAAERLEEQLRGARAELAAVVDDEAVAGERLEFLTRLGRSATGAFARALAAGDREPAAAVELGGALADQQTQVRQERRELAERKTRLEEQIAAYVRGLEARRRQRDPDRQSASVALEVTADATVTLELSYLVDGAGWHSAYDVRLTDNTLKVTWFGVITQRTGEDWPECDLRLSTARPSGEVIVPELQPWYLDRVRPLPPPMPLAMARSMAPGGPPMPAPAAAPMQAYAAAVDAEMAAPITGLSAAVEQGVTAATYQPARPVAVPADGGAHRATVAVVDLDAVLDYLTAPVRGAEAHLRAVVTNTSAHTLLPGLAAVFHGGDFIGSTALSTWAPGEEVELALGVDDRLRVERELVRRTSSKAVLGSSRRLETEHRITIRNHTPRAARVTVLDQIPVSKDPDITVKEARVEPAPSERGDLGVLTWVLDLEPGAAREILLGIRVELGRGVEVVGWRE